MTRYINLESALCRELDKLEEKYRSGAEMSEGDLRRVDLLTHSLKSLGVYVAKKEAEEAQRMAYQNNGYYVQNNGYVDQNKYQGYMPTERRW